MYLFLAEFTQWRYVCRKFDQDQGLYFQVYTHVYGSVLRLLTRVRWEFVQTFVGVNFWNANVCRGEGELRHKWLRLGSKTSAKIIQKVGLILDFKSAVLTPHTLRHCVAEVR